MQASQDIFAYRKLRALIRDFVLDNRNFLSSATIARKLPCRTTQLMFLENFVQLRIKFMHIKVCRAADNGNCAHCSRGPIQRSVSCYVNCITLYNGERTILELGVAEMAVSRVA